MRRPFSPGPRRASSLALCCALLPALQAACDQAPPPPPPPAVQVMPVTPSSVPVYAEYTGQTRGSIEVEARARVEGILAQQHYRDGTDVQKGELLFTIDPASYQVALMQARSRLAEAQAGLTRAENDVRRFRPLAEARAIPQMQLDNAVSAVEAARAQVAAARAEVDRATLNDEYTRVRAEVSGLAGKAEVLPGNLVGRGEPTVLTRISRVDPIHVRFSIPEGELLRLTRERAQQSDSARRAGTRGAFELVLADGSVHPHKGDLVFGDRQIDPSTGALLIEVGFPNPARTVRPGQFARVRFVRAALDSAFLVPQRAVRELQGIYQVAVVGEGDRVSMRRVTSPAVVGGSRVVTAGLRPGERIVVEGMQKVRDSVVVRTSPWAPPAASPVKP